MFLTPQSSPDFLRGKPGDANDFVAAVFAGRNSNGGTRNLQKICQEFNAGLVGAAVEGRSRQRQFKRTANLAGNGVLLGARLHLDGEPYAAWAFVEGNHASILPVPSLLGGSPFRCGLDARQVALVCLQVRIAVFRSQLNCFLHLPAGEFELALVFISFTEAVVDIR